MTVGNTFIIRRGNYLVYIWLLSIKRAGRLLFMKDQSKFVKDVKAFPKEEDIAQDEPLKCSINFSKVKNTKNAKTPGTRGLL